MKQGNGPPNKVVLMSVLSQIIPSINTTIVNSAVDAGHGVYARAYHLAWASIVPFVVVAIICCALVTNIQELMTEKSEASMEGAPGKTTV
jgi:hypothetical protein